MTLSDPKPHHARTMMEYRGRHTLFDSGCVRTHPLRTRPNKVHFQDLVLPAVALETTLDPAVVPLSALRTVASAIHHARSKGLPVIVFTGAHLIKNGLGPLLVDLVRRKLVTLVAGNAATSIHDFELALIGETSENVPSALGRGEFGMAHEFAYINTALSLGNRQRLGYGEALGLTICDPQFRRQVFDAVARPDSPREFLHPEVSVLAACHAQGIPFTVHAGLGVDVIDQHPSFDGEAKGGCSGRDFLIFCHEVTRLKGGGVVLNIGSAVQGPEVLLKAVSMAANAGQPPAGLVAADFDLREYAPDRMTDETAAQYYYRDHKSVVTRIPHAFGGRGVYVQGDQILTVPALYRCLMETSGE